MLIFDLLNTSALLLARYIYIYIYVVAMPKSVLTLSIEMHPSGKDDQLEFPRSLERLGPLFMLVSVA